MLVASIVTCWALIIAVFELSLVKVIYCIVMLILQIVYVFIEVSNDD